MPVTRGEFVSEVPKISVGEKSAVRVRSAGNEMLSRGIPLSVTIERICVRKYDMGQIKRLTVEMRMAKLG
jgi:hypothetical protein